jgi:hypothetical protein
MQAQAYQTYLAALLIGLAMVTPWFVWVLIGFGAMGVALEFWKMWREGSRASI